MKRLLLFVAFLALCLGEVLAQKNFILSTLDHKGFASLSAGFSMPTCRTPFGKNTQDMMGNGQSAQASVGYRIGRRLGVVGSYAYTTNTVQPSALIRSMAPSVDASEWDSRATNCTLQSLMAGPLLSVPSGRFLFDFQLTAGVAQATSSNIEINSQTREQPVSYSAPARSTYALAAGAGATTRYKLSRWLAVHASVNYITADVRFKDLSQEISVGGRQQTVEALPARQPTGLVNLSGGLSFIF